MALDDGLKGGSPPMKPWGERIAEQVKGILHLQSVNGMITGITELKKELRTALAPHMPFRTDHERENFHVLLTPEELGGVIEENLADPHSTPQAYIDKKTGVTLDYVRFELVAVDIYTTLLDTLAAHEYGGSQQQKLAMMDLLVPLLQIGRDSLVYIQDADLQNEAKRRLDSIGGQLMAANPPNKMN